MDIALLVARLLLAAVFALAAFGKITDPRGSREALAGFGVPRVLTTPFAILLPLAELSIAVLLIPTATAAYAAIGALVLLLLFIIGIAVSMARGQAPDCHCFGQLHSEPAGWSTLIRNFALAGVAGFVAVAGWEDAGTSAVSWIGDLNGFEQVALVVGVVMAVAIAIEAWLLLHALGQNGRLLFRLEAIEGVVLGGEGVDDMDEAEEEAAAPARGLPLGAPAPAFALSGIFGEMLTLDALRAQGKPVMLVFSDPNCGPCNALLPDLANWQREHFGSLATALISRGSVEANREKVGRIGLSNVLLQQDREVSESYNAPATPSAVIVSADGAIASALAEGAQAIRLLVSRTTAGSAAPSTNGGAARADVPVAARTPAVPAAPVVPNAPAPQPARSAARAAAQPAAAAAAAAAAGSAQPRPAPTRDRAARGRENRERPNRTGQQAPALNLPDLNGNQVSLDAFRGRDTAVLFWNPGCGFCRRMLDDIKAWEANPPADAPQLLVVSTGTPESNLSQGMSSTTVLDQGFSVGRQFGATGTPSAILIDSNGVISSGVSVGAESVMSILRGGEAPPPGDPSGAGSGGRAAALPKLARMGDEAPAVVLPDLGGQQVDLASFRGSKTLVMFWNPGCGFCRRMLDDLKAYEANPPKDAPQLVFVSTGDVDSNMEMGLNSTIVLDQGFNVGRAFGATGTPSAVMIDQRGRISSPVAAGAPAVMELAGWRGSRAVSV